VGTAKANITSCTVTLTPNSVAPATNSEFTVRITNTSAHDIVWADFSVPLTGFIYTGNNTQGWTGSDHSDGTGTTMTGSTISTNDHADFSLMAIAAITNAPSSNWQIKVSDNSQGANPFNCSGDVGTAIAGHPLNTSNVGVSNVQISNLTPTSVTVTWDSDNPSTSLVYYGTTANYGDWTNHDQTMTASHTVNLTGLTPDTGYHFQVAGHDEYLELNPYYSSDNTFITPPRPSSTPPPQQTVTLLNLPITNPGDKTPPTISLVSTPQKVVKIMPAINGVANDNQAVAAIEYSIDNGQNWLPVDSAPALGAKQVPFSFTPLNLEDGNYIIIARAVDGGGNITKTTPLTIVVDRLPPLVGGVLVSLGPQILTPDKNNVVTTLAGIDQKITMSAVGGPTSITINATREDSKTKNEESFHLTQDANSELWSGLLSFEQAGVYGLVANSIDGAGNKTTHKLNTINVSSAARVVEQGSSKTLKAGLKLYAYDTDTGSWTVWDGSPFGQTNPQTTGADGSFKLFLPSGKYYLTVTANDYKPLVSNIFNLGKTTPLTTQISMNKVGGHKLGPIHLSLPNFSSQAIDINPKVPKVANGVNPNKLIDKSIPNLTLPGTKGGNVESIAWLGRPTLLSFMVSWLPSTSEQLKALSELQTNKDINIVPIALQENSDKMSVYTQTAGYSLNWLVDPDSTLTDVVNIQSLPTHYFVNRDGVVKKVVTGILSKQQIIDELSVL
jgi:hypothetical protein